MPTVVFSNAEIYAAGYELTGDLNQAALTYEAESLDATVFGNTTRQKKGGLKMASASVQGFWQSASPLGVDEHAFDSVGRGDDVLTLFPDGITEGSTSTGAGFAFKITTARYTLGGRVGDLLPFTLDAEGRGAQ